ncbi:MAG: hypothetical protein AB7S93_05560 [Xanthobacteraceae bacterium]
MLRKGNVLNFVIGICALAVSVGLGPSTAAAQDDGRVSAKADTQALAAVNVGPEHAGESSSKPYFVEFRARSAYSYGHTFLVHGRVGQRITKRDVIGLHPATESSVPWMIGHIIPVVSETGASDGDYEDKYIIARYRVLLTEAEYKKTLGMMRGMQRNHPVWHAVLYNCNRFVGDIAQNMGLRAPGNSLLMPKEYINTLKAVNGGRSALSGSGSSRQAASASKRSQTAKRQPAANVRQEANVRVDPRHD